MDLDFGRLSARASGRASVTTASGAASTLLAFNQAHGTAAGFYEISKEAALDESLARMQVGAASFEIS
ncbi:hypothetical protein D3C83_300940 [compost metagenome]